MRLILILSNNILICKLEVKICKTEVKIYKTVVSKKIGWHDGKDWQTGRRGAAVLEDAETETQYQ